MQRIVNRSFGLGCGLLVLCAGLAGCSSRKAPNWTFADNEGSIRTISEYKGQVMVLGFSNTWCESNLEAALSLQDLHERFADQGVKVVYFSAWERGDPVTYMQENGFTYGLIVNATTVAREYKVDRIPTFFVVGVDGRVIHRD